MHSKKRICQFLTIFFTGFSSVAALADKPGLPLTIGSNGLVYLACRIGSETGQCILDTGGNVSFVSETADSKTIPIVQTATEQCQNTKTSVPLVGPTLIRVGQIAVMQPLVVRTNQYSELPKYLGVIGSDVILGAERAIFDFIGLVDVGKSRVIYSGPMLYTGPDITNQDLLAYTSMANLIKSDKVAVEVVVDGETVKALWDPHSYSQFSMGFIQRHPQLFKFDRSEPVGDVCGASASLKVFSFYGKVCAAGRCLQTEEVIGTSDFMASNDGVGNIFDLVIGFDLIEKSSWYFDFKHQLYSTKGI